MHTRSFCEMVQLPLAFRLDESAMHVRGFLNYVVLDRSNVCGDRLNIAYSEGAMMNGDIFWADCGAYSNQFDIQDRLVMVTHNQTMDRVETDPMEYLRRKICPFCPAKNMHFWSVALRRSRGHGE